MLRTNKCILTKAQLQDYEDIKTLYTNTDVRRYLGGPVDEKVFRAGLIARLESGTQLYWIIRHASDNEFIGSVSLDLHHDGINIEISYLLLPKWWGQGYATEVVRRVIEHAFIDLGLSKLVAETQTTNEASCRLLEKVGMQLEQVITRFGEQQAIYNIVNPCSVNKGKVHPS